MQITGQELYASVNQKFRADNDNKHISCEELEALRDLVRLYVREGIMSQVHYHMTSDNIVMALNDRVQHRAVFWVTKSRTDKQFPIYALDFPGEARQAQIDGFDRLCRIIKRQLEKHYPLSKPPISLVPELT